MNEVAATDIVDNYFRFMQYWDVDVKKKMINKLNFSINQLNTPKNDFSTSYGTWQDNRKAQEIIDDIYSDRINHNQIVEF